MDVQPLALSFRDHGSQTGSFVQRAEAAAGVRTPPRAAQPATIDDSAQTTTIVYGSDAKLLSLAPSTTWNEQLTEHTADGATVVLTSTGSDTTSASDVNGSLSTTVSSATQTTLQVANAAPGTRFIAVQGYVAVDPVVVQQGYGDPLTGNGKFTIVSEQLEASPVTSVWEISTVSLPVSVAPSS